MVRGFLFTFCLAGTLARASVWGDHPGAFLWTPELHKLSGAIAGNAVTDSHQTKYSILVGALLRPTEWLEMFTAIPWRSPSLIEIEDVSLGARITLLRSLFEGETHPTIRLIALYRTPSEILKKGRISVGLELNRTFQYFTLDLGLLYHGRFSNSESFPRQIALSENITFGVGGQFFVGAGLEQRILFQTRSGVRIDGAFSLGYFLTPAWSLTAQLNSSVPFLSPPERTLTVGMTYGMD